MPGQIAAILVADPSHSVFYGPFAETLENLTAISETEKYVYGNNYYLLN